VLRHGIQCIMDCDLHAYDYGEKGNTERYGTRAVPSYRPDFWLLDVPVHFVAGGKDFLIPVANIEEQHVLINMMTAGATDVHGVNHPKGLSSIKTFDTAGHLQFTLTMDDPLISHVLDELEVPLPEAAAAAQRDTLAASTMSASGTTAAVAAGAAAGLPDVPPVLHEQPVGAVPPTAAAGAAGSDGSADYWSPPRSVVETPGVLRQLHEYTALGRQKRDEFGASLHDWTPARHRCMMFPWLAGFTKLDVVLDGFDDEAHEMGLARE